MKRVLILASYADSLLNFRGALIQSAILAGAEVHVAAPGLTCCSKITKELECKGVVVHDVIMRRAGLNPIFDIVTFFSIFIMLRAVKPNVMLSYTVKPVIYGGIAAWFARVQCRFSLITGLGYAFTGNASGKRKFLKRVVRLLYRFSLARSHGVFFQNPDDEALFRGLDILPGIVPSFVVNGSGVDTSEYRPAPFPSRTSFLLIARLLGDKGVREYVQAAESVKLKYPKVSFGLVGWIDENPDAIGKAELDSWVKAGTIDFLGKLADVKPAITNSSVYVLPSYREGTPRTVLEAMAMGRPVITTDAPGCRETLVDGYNGFLVPVKDVNGLVAAILRFIESPEIISVMGGRSRTIAENKYDVNKVNSFMLNKMGIQ
ncbi:glycosyltransferase family 4 protein [Alcanivorax sp. DG881]|uniref:glycosyltransferase family 4 protein n=1 Tax=Alcanivorax sp. DG881 TaxID=236097 RepID=UPI0002F9FE5D|nr:glycosyltransferase family 4 protein [Alcanivorax sp. DG881]